MNELLTTSYRAKEISRIANQIPIVFSLYKLMDIMGTWLFQGNLGYFNISGNECSVISHESFVKG